MSQYFFLLFGPGLWRFPLQVLALLFCLVSLMMANARAADVATPVQFDISEQPLTSGLDTFSMQSGYQVSADATALKGIRARPVSGYLRVSEALDLMLAGTGLSWQFGTGKTVIIRPWSGVQGIQTLPPIRVQADGPAQAASADRPYTTAGSSAYIGGREIERYRGMSVGDMFRGTTGVLVAENRNSGGLNINIRGMQGQGRVPVLVDGARQETTVYRGYAGVTSRTYVDPDLIGGVEIDKGPSMAATGTGAVGGLVSMHTIGADDISKPGKDWGIRLRGNLVGNNSGSPAATGTQAGYATGGTVGTAVPHYRTDCLPGLSMCDGEYSLDNAFPSDATMNRPGILDLQGYSGSLAVARRLENADLVAAYARRSQGNYYSGENGPVPTLDLSERYDRGFYTEVRPEVDGASHIRGGEEVVNTSFENESLLLKTALYPDDAHTLELSYLRYDSIYGEFMPSQLLWMGKAVQTDLSEVTVDTYTSRYQWQPSGSDWVDLDMRVWYTDTESLNNGYTEEMKELLSQTTDREEYQRWGGDISNLSYIPLLGDFEARYGLAWQHERVRPEQGEVDAFSLMRDGERNEFSAFAALKWRLFPTLVLDAGIRYTRFDVEDYKPVVILDPGTDVCTDLDGDMVCDSTPDFSRNRQSGSAPVASLTWEPLEGVQVFFKYAEALRMPSLFESTAGFSSAPAPGDELKPEHAKNREAGINLLGRDVIRHDDLLRAKLVYFHNRTEDYITRTIPNTWEDSSAGLTSYTFRTRNIDSVEFKGIELSLEYDAGWIFASAAGTRYFDIETCHTGSYRRQPCTDYGVASSYVNNMIPPNWEANATLGFRPFDERVEFGTHVNWMGKRNEVPEYNDQTDTSRSFAEPVPWHGYRTIDIFASWRPNDTFSLDFNIDNVTDEYYLDALSLGLIPAPGRTAYLGFSLHY